jgi:methylated-DNA-[protein]-cysteine S-methyltransferase
MPPRGRRERQPHRLRRRARAEGAAVATRGRAPLRPVGPLQIVASERGLQRLEWSDAEPIGPPALIDATREQLAEYFAGRRTTFELTLDLVGTDFQRRAWLALAEIPYGETRTYAEQARRLGLARGARAVGSANARNPLPIVLPCHRLVGADGTLTGYAGGLASKERLLRLEGALRDGDG